ncbi:MAG: hypothetical protein ACK5M7_09305, partial [Draconibacterium sp.]
NGSNKLAYGFDLIIMQSPSLSQSKKHPKIKLHTNLHLAAYNKRPPFWDSLIPLKADTFFQVRLQNEIK